MTLDAFRSHCLKKQGFSEDFPFGPETLVFRVAGKIFALMDADTFVSVNLKCDPERAVDLRERYPGITPGYHAPSPERFGGVRHEQAALEHGARRWQCAGPLGPGTGGPQLRPGARLLAEEAARRAPMSLPDASK
jgi:hypothetical protein